MFYNMQNTVAQVSNGIFHQLFDLRIVKTNKTGLFTNFKISEIPEKITKGFRKIYI